MAITKSIRDKLFFLLIVMGALPFIFVIIVDALNTISELEKAAEENGRIRNLIISEHVTELMEENFYVLHALALNPAIVQYLEKPTREMDHVIEKLLKDTNSVFKDSNLMALTGKNAIQLFRTDNSILVNVKKRQHFKEAMEGRDFVSDVIVSMSTGKMIVVAEVAVKDSVYKPVGMLQRNLNLNALQYFVDTQGSNEVSVLILDRQGKVIAYSNKIVNFLEEHESEGRYKFIAEEAKGDSGSIHMQVNGEPALVNYSKNKLTGWTIVTVQPYHFMLEQVYTKIFRSTLIGLLMLFIVSVTAYLLSVRVTKPIIEIKNAADKIVKGNTNIEKIEVSSDDELGQMAEAFNKIRSARDVYRIESELDKLTQLYNKTTTETVCKVKLETFGKRDNPDSLLALYVIDLDHFKEINDTLGHQFGDKVLVEFARVLRKQFRPNDCIGRFGGDEFVVIIDNLPGMEIILRKAKQIKDVTENLTVDGKITGITASIGIAIAPQHGMDYETLFKSADKSLYHVKANGRNGYYYVSAEDIG